MCIHPFVHLSMMIPFWCISKSSADVNKLYHPPQYFSTHSTNYSSRFTYVVKSQSRSVVSNSLQPCELHSPWNSPGQNPGVGSLSLLQGIFPTHGSNPGLSHCRQILDQLSLKGSPRLLEWVAHPFSSGSS